MGMKVRERGRATARAGVRARAALAAAMLGLLAGCGEVDLHTRLSEGQANEMVAVLRMAGVDARKQPGGEAGWRVTTSDGDFARAVEVLRASGYPRAEQATLAELFRKEGFVSSPIEERARLKHGLQQELERALSGMDGVVAAHVMLDIPEYSPLADRQRTPTASVVLYEAQGANLAKYRANVRALVASSVSGLPAEGVGIQILPHQPLPVQAPAMGGARSIAGLGTAILLMVAAAAGWAASPGLWAWARRRLGGRATVPEGRPELPGA